jgi:CrcB protein
MNLLWVAAGSAIGGVTRYYIGMWVTNASGNHTIGTVLINIAGSFAIGMFLPLSADRSWSNALVLFVSVGFLGGFTTFSAFSWHTYEYWQSGEIGRAVLNVAMSVGLSLLAVWAGASVAKAAV